MKTIEQIPTPDKNNEGAREELLYGKYSLTDKEKEEIRKRAEETGQDPEAAVKAAEERMKTATARLREKQAADALKHLKESLEKK